MLTIESLSQYRERVRHKEEIREMLIAPGVVCFCYMISKQSTFDDFWAREARGICFSERTGKVIARPLHKFFNIGERPDTRVDNLNLNSNLLIMPKLDGSLIHTVLTDTGLRLKSKKSFESDVAKAAEAHAFQGANGQAFRQRLQRALEKNNATAIFEWTSPDSRIVLEYKTPSLTLLHIRDNLTGRYWSRDEINLLDITYSLFLRMQPGHHHRDALKLLESAKTDEGIEGWVFQFPETGEMVKLKTEWYLRRHRAITFVRERDIAEMVLDEGLDDLKSILQADGISMEPVLAIEVRVVNELLNLRNEVVAAVRSDRHLNRKDFAVKYRNHPLFSLMMSEYSGKDADYNYFFKKNLLKERYGLSHVAFLNSTADKD